MTQYPTPLLPLDRIPQVALESMNQTHREEVERINRLAGLVAQGMLGKVDEASVTHHLAQWIDHTRQHFARENTLMVEYGFPAYAVHLGEHQRILELLESLQQDWLKRQSLQPLADFLFDAWQAWFDNHVQTMDSVTADFLLQASGGAADL
jgi:hemerythrin